MAYNIYSTPLGLLPSINDTTIYNAAVSFGTRVRDIIDVRNGALTTYGDTLFSMFDWSQVYLTLLASDTADIYADYYNALAHHVPNLVIKQVALPHQDNIIIATDTNISLNAPAESNISTINANQKFVYLGAEYTTPNQTIFGELSTLTSAATIAAAYRIAIPIFNDDFSASICLYINTIGTNYFRAQMINYSNPNIIQSIYSNWKPYTSNADPYEPGGTSETGGGTGTFDLSSDSIDFPSLPTLTAVSTGLVSIYTPTLTQLNSLANFLWNANPTDVDWWKKLVANPLDLILGLSIVPVAVPAGASQNIKVGLIDTGVAMTKAATQFVTVDCGSINVAEVWGSALDYSPFTKFSIYLPFIGTRTINTDDIMGKTVRVKYNVDLLSGACTAMVKCGDSVLYQYSGACAISLPLTGETFTSMITSTIQLAASLGATVASGGAAAGITAASAANSVMSMKPQIERAGGVSGAAGQLGIMTPYLIAEVPRQSVPARYNTFAGYPSNINAVLGDLTGYTEVETIYIKGISATKTELDEIETLLKAGVII